MTSKKTIAALALAAAFGVLTGCSDDKKDSSSDSSSLSKADFLTQGNALCATFNAEMDAADDSISSDDEAVVFVSETLAPGLRALLRSIEDLGYPEGDGEQIQAMIDDTDDVLDQIEADPAAFVQSPVDPFAAINARLRDYGLTTCGQG